MDLHMRVWQASLVVRMPDGTTNSMGLLLVHDKLPTVYWVERAVHKYNPKLELIELKKLDRMPPAVVA